MSAAPVLTGPWRAEPAKRVDIPISATGLYGERVVVARVPKTSKIDAERVAILVESAPELLKALVALEWAVSGVDYMEEEYAEQIAAARAAIHNARREVL